MGMFDYDEQVKDDQKEIEYLKTKITYNENKNKILQDMLLNVCKHAYLLKGGRITVDQLLSVVNGCLDEKVIDRFTWDYLLDEKTREVKLKEQSKDILEKYTVEYDDIDISFDDIDTSSAPIYSISQKEFYDENLSDEDLKYAFNEFSEGALNSTQIIEALESGELVEPKFKGKKKSKK